MGGPARGQCWHGSCATIRIGCRGHGPARAAKAHNSRPACRLLCSPGLPQPSLRNQGHISSYGLLLRLSTLHSTCTVTPATQKFFGMWSLEPERLVIPISQLAECFRFFFQTTGIDDVEIHLFLIYRGEMVVQSLKYLPRNLAASITNLNSVSWRPPKWGCPNNSVLGLCFCWWRLTALVLAWLKILRLILNRPEIQTNPASSHPPCNSPRNYSVCKEPWL